MAALDLALSEAGFLTEGPNDQFDYDTLKAVLDLQFQMDLDVDGLAGPNTLGALGL
ncbi:MAG: peptidoglycan-binding domain-containing protein [Actinomycetota bacterium]